MPIKGLIAMDRPENSPDAATHRALMMGKILEKNHMEIDYFHVADHILMGRASTGLVTMPFHVPRFRGFDFIHLGTEETAYKFLFCKPFLKCPVIVDIDGDPLTISALKNEMASEGGNREPSPRARFLNWSSIRIADQILTNCKPHVLELINSGVDEDRVSLMRNGVDLELFKASPMPEEPEYLFGYAGEFQFWQAPRKLLQSLAMVEDKKARFLLIGFRPEDRDIKREFAETLGHRATLVDYTDRETLVDLMQRAAVHVITRKDHRANLYMFPTRFAESASMARPILVNDVDETPDFIEKYRCGFVSGPSAEDMAAKMNRITGIPREKLAEMGAMARKMALENFSYQVLEGQYMEIVNKVLERAKP
jgi:glycosyltransferase involved in cell wall biosynthesis